MGSWQQAYKLVSAVFREFHKKLGLDEAHGTSLLKQRLFRKRVESCEVPSGQVLHPNGGKMVGS
jgi:hypothetical protein